MAPFPDGLVGCFHSGARHGEALIHFGSLLSSKATSCMHSGHHLGALLQAMLQPVPLCNECLHLLLQPVKHVQYAEDVLPNVSVGGSQAVALCHRRLGPLPGLSGCSNLTFKLLLHGSPALHGGSLHLLCVLQPHRQVLKVRQRLEQLRLLTRLHPLQLLLGSRKDVLLRLQLQDLQGRLLGCLLQPPQVRGHALHPGGHVGVLNLHGRLGRCDGLAV
mmetsp:Transcript_30515/g.86276  ORF Transcript_30515/g.86276 Transcript_30515/m.86276 type:complete len:218 (+) Transcript_30515:2623-3276(+)